MTKEPPGLLTPKPAKPTTNLTNRIVNQYIQEHPEHPETVSTYLRNGQSMKAQRKQTHVRSLLDNGLISLYFIYSYQTWRIKRKRIPWH